MSKSRTKKTPCCYVCGRALEAGMIRFKTMRCSPQDYGGRVERWLCELHNEQEDEALTTVRDLYYGPYQKAEMRSRTRFDREPPYLLSCDSPSWRG